MRRFDAYVICTSPRSGSTLLCRLLRQCDQAGFPGSHFHEPSLEKWLGYYGLRRDEFGKKTEALRAVFDAAIAFGKAGDDIFALRLQRHSFEFFAGQLALLYPLRQTDKSRIEAAFGRTLFIHLTRENKLNQAISYVKAEQSGLWHRAPDGTELERLSEPREPRYDRVAISSKLTQFAQMEAEWQAWFSKECISPLRLTYDELSLAPYATLTRVLGAIGLKSAHVREQAPPVAKLADATNAEWAERFRAENSELTDPDQ